MIGKLHGRRFIVDRDQCPGLVDQRPDSHRFHLLLADPREIDQALADALQPLGHPLHAREAVERLRVVGGLDQFFDRAVQDRQRRIQLMRDAGREQAEADQAVLFLESPQRGGQLVFLASQRCDRIVARAHDLPDLVAQDIFGRNQFALAVARLGGRVGFEHPAQRPVHVQRHDGRFQQRPPPARRCCPAPGTR